MTVRMKQYIERQIIAAFVDSCLREGHNISVSDGEDVVLWNSTSMPAIMSVLQTTDEDRLYVDAEQGAPGVMAAFLGEVQCIYGNEGHTVICDYHTCLEPLMKDADALADWWDGDGPWVEPPFKTVWVGVGPGVLA